jgi:LysM repeat protein
MPNAATSFVAPSTASTDDLLSQNKSKPEITSNLNPPQTHMSTPKPKKKGTALLENLLGGERRRHQVAMITEEGDWNQHESNSGMARVFVVMLLVHVVLIGSIIVYDFVGTDEVQPAPAPVVSKTPAADPHELTSSPVNSSLPDATTSPLDTTSHIPASGEYEVQSGDSLPSIAARLGVSQEELVALNHLEDGNVEVKPLTVLKVPANKIADPARVAIVKEFPPIASAETPVETPAANVIPIEQTPPPAVVALADSQVSIDTTPPTPAPMPVVEAPPAPKPEPVKVVQPKPVPTPAQLTQTKPETKKSTPSAAGKSHTMTKGETLYSLARKYGVSITAIQKANKITNPNAIREGSKLIIPGK